MEPVEIALVGAVSGAISGGIVNYILGAIRARRQEDEDAKNRLDDHFEIHQSTDADTRQWKIRLKDLDRTAASWKKIPGFNGGPEYEEELRLLQEEKAQVAKSKDFTTLLRVVERYDEFLKGYKVMALAAKTHLREGPLDKYRESRFSKPPIDSENSPPPPF